MYIIVVIISDTVSFWKQKPWLPVFAPLLVDEQQKNLTHSKEEERYMITNNQR
jgi:hypothetical protein